jgi:hypothetical protein
VSPHSPVSLSTSLVCFEIPPFTSLVGAPALVSVASLRNEEDDIAAAITASLAATQSDGVNPSIVMPSTMDANVVFSEAAAVAAELRPLTSDSVDSERATPVSHKETPAPLDLIEESLIAAQNKEVSPVLGSDASAASQSQAPSAPDSTNLPPGISVVASQAPSAPDSTNFPPEISVVAITETSFDPQPAPSKFQARVFIFLSSPIFLILSTNIKKLKIKKKNKYQSKKQFYSFLFIVIIIHIIIIIIILSNRIA